MPSKSVCKTTIPFLVILSVALISPPLHAEQPTEASAAAQANNPLANMTAFNLQNYYIGELTESDDNANQFWFRFAQPFNVFKTKWLVRASLPVNTYPTPPDNSHETGLGDLNVFAAYLFETKNPAVSFGFGPQITMPTATKDEYGIQHVYRAPDISGRSWVGFS